MTSPVLTVKLSPSGKKIGNPPYQVGPGSIGLVYRARGDASSGPLPVYNGTGGTIIPGLGGTPGATFTALMRPGYKYEVKVDYPVQTLSPTADPIWTTYFRTHDVASGVWGAWVPFQDAAAAGPPNQLFSPQATTNYHKAWVSEDYIDFTVTASSDAVQIMLICDGGGTLGIFPNGSFARVEEYLP
jgi:hypothetical protein